MNVFPPADRRNTLASEGPDDAISGLNPEQIEAVTHGEGPLLVISGAGTGKTCD